MKVFVTKSTLETQKLAEKFAQNLKKGVIALYGELGSGKTTFVQGLAKGLGIEKRITSPTFTIVRSYKSSIKYHVSSIKYFYHIDLYRIEDHKEIKNLGINEILNNSQDIIVIEWAERMKESLPEKRIDIFFEYIDKDERKITVSSVV